MGRSRKVKTFSYRLPLSKETEDATVLETADWWEGFEYVTGPVMVFWKHPKIGAFQVWAITEGEGKSVIGYALAHMNVDPAKGKWRVAHVTNPRYGKSFTVRATAVSCRASASGPPATVILDKYALKEDLPIPTE